MNTKLKALLEEASLDGYKIQTQKTESYELFFVHRALETVRATDTDVTSVTVYSDHDGKKGDASFFVYASTTDDEIRTMIAAAVDKAKKIENQYYDLPADETLDGEIPSNFTEYDPCDLASAMADAVFDADTCGNGSVNALEIFINRYTVSVVNSRGIDKREVKYGAVVEVIPTWNEGESVELYQCERFNRFDPAALKESVEEKMREVRDRGRAAPPSDPLKCPVVLGPHELASLFFDLAGELGYGGVYAHSNAYSLGDEVQKNCTGDRLTITMRGSMEGSSASALFDGDGTTLTDTTVIENGVVSHYYGSHRFAQYLNLPATGQLRCLEANAGTCSRDDLASQPYFRCVSMSGLQVDIFNDYIGGEVRLAYYCDGDKTIPVTGISISGKLSDALSSLRLSRDVIGSGNYRGPDFALLNGIEIV